jgi:hypothetical protein
MNNILVSVKVSISFVVTLYSTNCRSYLNLSNRETELNAVYKFSSYLRKHACPLQIGTGNEVLESNRCWF